MKSIDLQIIIWKEQQHFVAQCLNVDVSSFGSTLDEAKKNIQEALELYFEDTNHDSIIEVGKPTIVTQHVQYA